MWKGRDPGSDQSYFLYGTTRDQLDYLRFPLGDLPKRETRKLAADAGLVVAEKPDSQDICFVPDGDYAGLVKRLRPETAAPGDIVDLDGSVLGQHQGVVHFTIGQRRGIEIGGQPEPLYVVRIEPEERRLVVGPRRALAVAAAKVEGVNWLAEDQNEGAAQGRSPAPPGARVLDWDQQTEVAAKVRSLARPVAGSWNGDKLTFAPPEYGVAPGQSAVFYDGERLLGGGTIVATEAAELEKAVAA